MNFQSHIIKIENILQLWHRRNLTIEGKGLVFKSLAIYLLLTATVLHARTTQMNIIQKNLIWNEKNSRIKHSILSNSYKDSGFESCDIFAKVISLQCSWIKRLFVEKLFHEWEINPIYLIKTNFCKNFKFHPCLGPSISSLKNEPIFFF